MLEIRNLTVVYPDGTKAVDDLSLTMRDGESVALAGANGAGKTSLLLALVGVLPARAGEIAVDGIVLSKSTAGEVRRRIGLVFQNPDDQLFMPVVRDDVAFGPRNLGLPEAEVARRVEKALAALGVKHLKDRSPLRLSGGEKRMAAIAAVLAMEPSVLAFDEPTAFLDPRARRTLINVMLGLGHGKLVATHDLYFAEEVCNRAVLMRKGRLFAEGEPREIFRDGRLMEECGLEAIR